MGMKNAAGGLVLFLGLAAQGDTSTTTAELEKVIVTATRRETQLKNAPAIGDVVGRGEIEEIEAPQVSDALKYVPGVSVESGTGSGGPAKRNVSINGMPNYYNVVMINGMRLLSSHFHTGANVDLIPATAVDRVEIVKDASSALYGSDALGGVVNIVTRKGSGIPEMKLSGSYGSFDTWSGEALSSGMTIQDKAAYSLYAGYERSDGVKILSPGHRLDRMGYRKASMIGRVDTDIADLVEIGGNFNLIWTESEFMDAFQKTGLDTIVYRSPGDSAVFPKYAREYDFQSSLLLNPGLDIGINISDELHFDLLTYYTRWEAEISAELNEIVSARPTTTYELGNNLITAGYELMWRNFHRNGMMDTTDQFIHSVFAQDEFSLLDSTFILLGAVRSDYVSNTEEDVDDIGPVLSPKLSGLYKPIDVLSFRLTLGRGFKAPSVQELYEYNFHRYYWRLGNANLQPEYSWNVAAGAEVTPLPWWSFKVNGFYNRVEDMIVLFKADRSDWVDHTLTFHRGNVDEGTIAGAEAQTSFGYESDFYGGRLDLGGAYVRQTSSDDSLKIPYYPGTTGFARLTGRFSLPEYVSLRTFVGMNIALGRESWAYTKNEFTALDDLYNLEAGLSIELIRKYNLYFRASNILDQEFETYEDLTMRIEGVTRFEGGFEIDIQ